MSSIRRETGLSGGMESSTMKVNCDYLERREDRQFEWSCVQRNIVQQTHAATYVRDSLTMTVLSFVFAVAPFRQTCTLSERKRSDRTRRTCVPCLRRTCVLCDVNDPFLNTTSDLLLIERALSSMNRILARGPWRWMRSITEGRSQQRPWNSWLLYIVVADTAISDDGRN